MCRNNDRDKKQREETKIQLKTNAIMCGKFEIKQAEKKNGWASKYQQEASQNLSPKQWQQKLRHRKDV